MFLQIFHFSAFLFNLYTFWYDQQYVKIPFPHEKLELYPLKARCIFLTMWCFIIQTAYFGVALLNDIVGTNDPWPKSAPIIRAIKDAMFGVAFPFATYVSSVFWTLYYINRELIFPERMDDVFPRWVNHAMHTAIFVLMIAELLSSSRRRYLSTRKGFLFLTLLNIAYISCLFYVYYDTDVWVYPLFAVLSWPVRAVFFILNSALVFIVCHLCERMNMAAQSLRVVVQVKKKC